MGLFDKAKKSLSRLKESTSGATDRIEALADSVADKAGDVVDKVKKSAKQKVSDINDKINPEEEKE